MSYPIPSFDPSEDAVYPEDLGNNGEPIKEPVDAPEPDPDSPEALRQRDVYDAIFILKHARNDDLKEIVNGLPEFVKHRLSLYLTH